MREPLVRRFFLLGLLALVAWLALLNPPCDVDAFMHLRVGQWVLEHRAVPALDPFSRHDVPWVAYSWLFGIGTYLVFGAAGWLGVLLVKAALCVLAALLVVRLVERREPNPWIAAGLSVAAVLGLMLSFSPRPWLFSIIFFTIVVERVLRARETREARGLWLVPLIHALWANIHIQFVYGLLVLGLALLDAGHERWRGRATIGPRVWGGVLAASLLATLVGPNHVRVWATVFEYATYSGAFAVVSELQAPTFRVTRDWAAVGLGALGLVVLGWRREARFFPWALLACGFVLALRARRDAWVLDVAALAAIVSRDAGPESPTRPGRVASVVAAVAALCMAALFRGGEIAERRLEGAVLQWFPELAVRFVEEKRLEGPLYNSFEWGNFLYWRLPRLPVSLDGRTNLHGDERIARALQTCAGRRGWDEDPELLRARLVILGRDYPLVQLLKKDPRFELRHEDHVAVVLTRR